jgi:hypothetical protein
MHIFGLLHLVESEKTAMNLSTDNFLDQISVYVNNAKALSKSLDLVGISYTLLTNNKSAIQEILSTGVIPSFDIIEIPFSTEVPAGTRFYSAHFKLDAFKYLSTLTDGYYALCDLDMLCINPIPLCLKNLIKNMTPMYYDISDQVIPAYGHEIIINDLSKIANIDSEGRWAGGEFISGPPQFFTDLVKEIENVYDNYISNVSLLHHVGDEAYTSAALEKLRRKGGYIADAGSIGIVARYWNTRILHHQKSFNYYNQSFLLHLPADKRFLSKLAEQEMDSLPAIRDFYQNHRESISTRVRTLAFSLLRYFNAVPKTILKWKINRRL